MLEFRDSVLHIGGVSAGDLAARHGTPLYAYDAAILRRQAERIRTAFRRLPLQPFYAMKANDNIAILRLLRDLGFGCDAVSPGEVFIARAAGFTSDRIWFTCSNVSDDDLLALGDSSMVLNVNAMSDIDRCLRLGLTNPIALRVNPDIGAGHHRDVVTGGLGVKFGIDLAEIESARVYAESGGLEVVGLHAHIGSGIDRVEPLLRSAETLVALSEGFSSLRWVNFGGGIGVPYRPGDEEFPLEDYGERLSDIAAEVMNRRGIRAILEPGRFVVAESGTLIARVTSKRISSGREWIGCDTGFNHLARPSKYGSYHHIVNASAGANEHLRQFWGEAERSEMIVAGNLCESGDVFTRDPDGIATRMLPPVRIGDLLAFCDAGAYGFSMASHYNARLLPVEVMCDGGVDVAIRARQTYEQLLRGQ